MGKTNKANLDTSRNLNETNEAQVRSPESLETPRQFDDCDDFELTTPHGLHLKTIGSLPTRRDGMNDVLVAWDAGSEREVCVKVARHSTETALRGVGDRAWDAHVRIASHKNIVEILDCGEFDGRPYIVMEYVCGSDMHSLVKQQGPLPWRQACRIIRQVATALRVSHSKNVIHRDIKPANILVGLDGVAKVADWDLSAISSLPDIDFGGSMGESLLFGTLGFCAPEQASDPARADELSDLYSLGCTFYFALTGTIPFDDGEATPAGQLKRHAVAARPSVRASRRDVPKRIDQLTQRLMAVEPAQRFPSVEAFLMELRIETAYLPVRLVTKSARWALRLGAKLLTFFFGALATILIIVGYVEFFDTSTVDEIRSESDATTANDAAAASALSNAPIESRSAFVTQSRAGQENIESVTIPDQTKEKFPDLIELILNSESMNNSERQYWVNILPVMTPDQLERLRGILVNERDQLAAIDHKYATEMEQIRKQRVSGENSEEQSNQDPIAVPDDVRSRFPQLVELIVQSKTLTQQQKKEWLARLPNLNEDHISSLKAILAEDND